jgi:thiamine pyrophosphate-dependent acetolactate synthase large subunit-like protein
MPVLSGGQALARALHAEGVEVVFGIVGTHNAALFDGLYEMPALRVIAARPVTIRAERWRISSRSSCGRPHP